MIDLHSHILPGLDDGAGTMEDSLAMLRAAAASGVTDMVATPHADYEFEFHPEAAEQAIEEVRQAAGDGGPRIHYGCELHLTPENLEKAVLHPERYCIAHRNYVLVELSNFSIPGAAEEVWREFMKAGMVPILAHPERNPLLRARAEDLEDWIGQGCLVQLTGHSLLGRFGKKARAAAVDWMERGLVHFVATDAHDVKHRAPELDAAMNYVEQEFGAATAQRLFEDNPRCVLEGLPVPESERIERPRKWFSFW